MTDVKRSTTGGPAGALVEALERIRRADWRGFEDADTPWEAIAADALAALRSSPTVTAGAREGPNKRKRASKLEFEATRKFKVFNVKNPYAPKDDSYDLMERLLKSKGKVLTFGAFKDMLAEEFDFEDEKDLVKNTINVLRELESADPRIIKVIGA